MKLDIFEIALILGLVTALANILGSYLAILQYRPSRRFTAAALGFSGGFVLAAALLEMVPESLSRGASMPAFVALGYLLVFLMEQFLNVHLHHLPDEDDPAVIQSATGIASFVAFNTHDFIDGLAMGAAMVTDIRLGIVVSLAVILHEVPAGFVIAAIMRGAGWSRRAALMAGVSLGLITIVGIALPFWIGKISSFLTDALLALAAGTFIYLGATLLVPLSEAGKSRWITLLVFLGFAVFFASNWFVKFLLG
ncbi:MAG: ZIP family metal transporter [Candidatus Binatota bacterium]